MIQSKSLAVTLFATFILLASISAASGDLDLAAANAEADSIHSNGKTALMLAARDRDLARVRYLLERGANVNAANYNGGTPIMYAALGGDLEILRLLLGRGADLNAVAKNGWSALMIAAAKGFDDIARELLSRSANPNLEDVYSWSPLMRAVYEDRAAVVDLLAGYPATDINHRGENGVTALHIAVAQGNFDLVEVLLGNGADKSIEDYAGRTPHDIARQTNERRMLDLLQ